MRPHFHVAGVPVRVHPLFLVTALASGWGLVQEPSRLALWVAIVFASVLLHELGHAWAFRRHGCSAFIELHGMGGTTSSREEERLTHRQSAGVSFAGPATGFALGGLVWALSRYTPLGQQGGLVGESVRQLLWVNVGWGLFNLLPMQPLDGGHVLASLVRARKGYRYERVLQGVGVATALGVLVLAVVWKQPWMGLLAVLFGVINVVELFRVEDGPVFIRAAPPRPRASAKPRPSAAGPVRMEPGPGRPGSAPGAPSEARRAPASLREQEAAEPEGPHDPALVGAMLLESGLAAMAVRPLQTAFAASPSKDTGHHLVLALLETRRFDALGTLLAGPQASHLSDDTLALVCERAAAEGQDTLAERAGALRRGLGRPNF
jgi:stage IV sporulation protein FB